MAGRRRERAEGSLSQLLSGVGKLVERLPGASVVVRGARAAEDAALQLLRDRLERVDETTLEQPDSGDPSRGPDQALAQQMRALLERSADQSREQAQHDYFHWILGQLMPDEARILSALADGSAYALVHLGAGPALGGLGRRVLDNFSNVGKAAGVFWPELTQRYIRHLRDLDLVESGPEDPAMKLKYELIESDSAFRAAAERIGKQPGTRARPMRRTLKLSSVGRQFWDACNPDQPQG